MSSTNKTNKKNVLVIVAHSDDEALGMGGTIAIHANMGEKVYVISMTDGISSRGKNVKYESKKRKLNAQKSSKILEFTWLKNGEFPDNELDKISRLEVTKFIEEAKSLIKPKLIYTHSPCDLNIDHRIVYESTITAFRPQPNEVWEEIRTFEIPSATDYGSNLLGSVFNPNLYIDIASTIEKKISAIKEYGKEIREEPHTRSLGGVRNLAKYRGYQVGIIYAEAFNIVKKIVRG